MNTEPTLWRHARLATMDAAVSPEPYDLIAAGALLAEGDRLHWVGALSGLPSSAHARIGAEHDLGGTLVTPGLIDAHTHLVYAGERAREFELRLQGASYEQIARAGGGIRSTVAATRAADEASLLPGACYFLRAEFAAYAVDHPAELAYWFGAHPCQAVVSAGRLRTVQNT